MLLYTLANIVLFDLVDRVTKILFLFDLVRESDKNLIYNHS